ncbi:MAG: recombinase family protein [Mycobacterium sp.]
MESSNGADGTRPAGRGLAAIYARISEDREGDLLGVQRQEADCRVVCERRGFAGDRVHVYSDDDRSAFSGKVRPEYERLLRDIAKGQVQLLVAWHPDRLHRSPLELERFITIVEAAGTHIETARAGTLDLTSPTGRMTARIIGAVARG